MICICIALAGCGKEKSVVKEKKQKEVLRLTTKGKELVLKNLMNYKVVNKYKLGKKQCTGSIIELDQGYCVQIYEANRELKNQVIQGAVVEDTPDESEIVKASIKLFDKKLKETDTVDITRLAKERKDEDLLMTSFTVSPDGTKIAWNTGENILCYNRETKKFTKYNQITKKDITAENIIFAGNDKLAFYGTKASAAVSRYLNGGPLSEQKREAIREVVEKTGYRPDAAAQTLRTGRVNQIGVIAPSISSQSVGLARQHRQEQQDVLHPHGLHADRYPDLSGHHRYPEAQLRHGRRR